MEYWGNTFGEDKLYTICMHHQKREYRQDKPGSKLAFEANNRRTSHHVGLGDGAWHTMAWLWEEGRLTTYVDGKEIMTQRWSKDGYPQPDCLVKVGEPMPGIFSILDEQLLPVTISGAAGWTMEVDYLNIWQK